MDRPRFTSESFMMCIQHTIGVGFRKVEWEKEHGNPDTANEACRLMWCNITHWGRLIHGLEDCTFLSVALGPEKTKVAEYIKQVSGCNPWFDKEHDLYDWFNFGLK